MNVVCRVCGGTDYHLEGGLYYCDECQTQTQELHEQVFDDGNRTYLNTTKITIRKNDNDRKEKLKTWTTWEGYNIILKGLVDELISLGAPLELKLTTFQLWTAYLSAIKVAFFAEKEVNLPKLSAAFRLHDAQVMYNFVHTKPKKPKSKSKSSVISLTDLDSNSIHDIISVNRRRGRTKRALIRADYESSKPSENLDSMSEYSMTTKSVSSMSSTCSIKLNFNKNARKVKLKKLTRHHLKAHSYGDLSCHKFTTSEVSSNYLHSPYHLSISKLYAILYLALLICKSDIYISDLLHYIQEGYLSFADYKHLFPEEMAMDENYQKLFEVNHRLFTNSSLRLLTAKIAQLIGVKYIPCPDIEKLCLRYVTELHLPVDIMHTILHLLKLAPPKLKFKQKQRLIPNYEGRAMGYILFSLKLLFILDDCNEHNMSKIAKQLNKEIENETNHIQIFNWDKWVEYIECRKIFIADYHYPTLIKYFPYCDNTDNIHLFIDYWEKQKKKNDLYEENIYNTKLYTFRKIFESLNSKSSTKNKTIIEFSPNSSTPLNSALNKLSEILDKIPTILSQNFTESQIDYITNPSKFIKDYNLNAKIIKNKLLEESFSLPLPAFSSSNYIFNETFIPCEIVSKAQKIDEDNKSNKEEISDFYNKNEGKREKYEEDLVTLYEPYLKYWIEPSILAHENLKGHFEHVEKHCLPKSFQWLLKECAHTINSSAKELYRELAIIEVYLRILLHKNIKNKYCENNKKNRYFNALLKKVKKEW